MPLHSPLPRLLGTRPCIHMYSLVTSHVVALQNAIIGVISIVYSQWARVISVELSLLNVTPVIISCLANSAITLHLVLSCVAFRRNLRLVLRTK